LEPSSPFRETTFYSEQVKIRRQDKREFHGLLTVAQVTTWLVEAPCFAGKPKRV